MCHYIPKVLDLQYHIKHKVTLEEKKNNEKVKGQWSLRILVAVLVMSVSLPCCSKHGGEAMMVMVVMMETMMTCCLPSAMYESGMCHLNYTHSLNIDSSEV